MNPRRACVPRNEPFSVHSRFARQRPNVTAGLDGLPDYRHEIDEEAKTLKLWVRRKRGHQKLVCSGCGRELEKAHGTKEREVSDLPCLEFRTTIILEVYRVCCSDCGVKVKRLPRLPSKAPFQQTGRGWRWASLRECRGTAGGVAIRTGAQYRTRICGTCC